MSWKGHALNTAEAFRAAATYRKFIKGWPALRDSAPRGDGHPVLVLPPFGYTDTVTAAFRDALAEMGYKVYGWEASLNSGFNAEKGKHLRKHLKKIHADNGNRKVTVIGLSLGGIYARELGREFPELVRGAISINTPFGAGLNKDTTPNFLIAAIEALSDDSVSLKADGGHLAGI